MKICTICKECLPVTSFSPTHRHTDGSVKYRNSQCTRCRTNKSRKTPEYVQSAVAKECRHCRISKPHEEFSPAVRGKLGLSAYCKLCARVKYHDKERARLATQAYRERHPARWRAAHRIHQFNRRSLIKATEDGTVTNEFVEAIYAEELCYWCNGFTREEDRTLEHIIELSSGGLHSASNIAMACSTCNSSRLNKGVRQIEPNRSENCS